MEAGISKKIFAGCSQPIPARFLLNRRLTLRGYDVPAGGRDAARTSTKASQGKEPKKMKVIADLCVVPLGVGVSVSRYVAACEQVLREAGLNPHLHAYGTNIEGEWEQVFRAIRRCHEVVHEMGAPRITTTVKLGTRTDRDQTMQEKVRSVEERRREA